LPSNRCLPALYGAVLLIFSGCHTPAPPDVESTVTFAGGLGEPIVFRSEAGPLDEPRQDAGVLTLSEALLLTARHDARIQAALARVRIAQAESKQARLLPNPIVTLALRAPTDGGKTIIEAGLTAELVAMLQQPGRVSAADNRLRAEAANAVATVLDVLSETSESYVAAQALDALLSVQQDRRRILDRLLDLARARLNAGEGTQLDVTTFETQRVELETEVADKELERQQGRLKLARLIGAPSGEANWALSKWESHTPVSLNERQWVWLALVHRPEVTSAVYELRALGDEMQLTRWGMFGSTELGVASEKDPDWSVGPEVSVPLPIFDRGQASKARAGSAVIEARHKLLQAQREAVEETRSAYATYRASADNLARVKHELIPLQERRLSQAEGQYQAGQVEITSLFLAEQDLRTAYAQQIELQRRVTDSLIRLERSAGGSAATLLATTAPATGPTAPAPTSVPTGSGVR
jgi:outer membrane protein TolC